METVEDRILLSLFTSTKSGDWTDETVWGQASGSGAYPKAGDTVTITAGKVVTVSRDAAVGDSPASGVNVLNVLGELVIGSGATLTVRGDVLQSGTTGFNGQILCSGNLVMDGTASGVKYQIACGAQHLTTAKLVFTGTATAHASFSSLGNGSLNAFVSGGGTYIGAGRIEAEYTDFNQVGDAANKLSAVWLTGSASSSLILRHCLFQGCGRITTTVSAPPASNLDVEDCVWSSTLATGCITLGSSPTGTSIGTRVVRNNRFDKTVELFPVSDMSVDDNMMGGGYVIGAMNPASWTHNLIDEHNEQGLAGVLHAVDDYYYDDTGYNPHTYLVGQVKSNFEVDGLILDCPQGLVGDLVVGGMGPGNDFTLKVRNCIVLPNAYGTSPGKFISPSAAGFTYTVEHNTVISTAAQTSNAESGLAEYGETYPGMPGMYASLRSNLVYSPTGKGAFLLRHVLGYVSDPLASPSMGDYNGANAPITTTGSGVLSVYGAHGGYGDVASNQTNPTTPMFTNSTGLGAHDVVADPNFVDITRNVATFDTAYLKNTAAAWTAGRTYQVGDIVSARSPGFYGNALINYRCVRTHTSDTSATNGQPGSASGWRTDWELASLYRIRAAATPYDPAKAQATPRDLYEWVKAGASPTNAAYKSTAHDGGDIGAVSVVLAPIANAQTVTLGQGTSQGITLTATDPNSPEGPLSFSTIASPAHGILTGVAPNLIYTPDAGYFGGDSFTYSVKNAQGLSSSATVTLSVVGKPTALPRTVSLNQGATATVTLSGIDPNSPVLPLNFVVTVSPSHGTLSGLAPNLVYTPSPTWSGPDSFKFKVNNGTIDGSEAVVSINVIPEPAPTVSDILVHHGSLWTSVAAINRTLPWINIDAVEFIFSSDVVVNQNDLAGTGVNVPAYASNAFSYTPSTRAAVWRFPSALGVDLLTLTLDGHSPSAVQTPLGTKLNGGSDFVRVLGILPGDVNGDGTVDAKDVNEIRNDLLGIYIPNIFDDLDGDGIVGALDYNAVRSRTGKKLPVVV